MGDVGATIIMGISLGFCALVMIVIGVRQMKSETPVGFYTGARAIKPEEITDIPAWNRKHGIMWIVVGSLFVAVWVVGLFADGMVSLILMIAVTVLCIPGLLLYHHLLTKRYRIDPESAGKDVQNA